jgi:protein phosphatase 1D
MWAQLDSWPKTVYGLPVFGIVVSVAFIRKGKIYIGQIGDSSLFSVIKMKVKPCGKDDL